MARPDPHSYFDDRQPRTRHAHLALLVDFERRILEGDCTLELTAAGAGQLDLDTRGLRIESVSVPGLPGVPFALSEVDPVLGQRLRIHLPPGASQVTIRYRTTAESMALQWLEPEQTAGKRHPFLFSQCQAIHARTVAPLQDSPIARLTYSAELTIPRALSAVMSAAPGEVKDLPNSNARVVRFEMPQAIPPYLLALAVGELEGRDLSPRARVWAEPSVVEQAAWEFAEVESMIQAAEALFGPYDWERYDMIVLPPSFPYGGMENPRMTFLTPTLLSGDRSLVDVVAHELAHSWTGNLISNATADHFWLNEGFTVWAERRILEALHGEEAATLGWALGENSLEDSLSRLLPRPEWTRLRTDLAGIDPDEAYSTVPYEKGARFLHLLEHQVGRSRFDLFVRAYMSRFRFSSITTEQFLAFLEAELPGAAAAVHAEEWIHGAGKPSNSPVFRSANLTRLEQWAARWPERPTDQEAMALSAVERQLYLQRLPRSLDADALAWLDRTFDLSRSRNHEILVEWLVIALNSDYQPVFARAAELTASVGRMKYLRPLYRALGRHPRTRDLGREIFARAARSYHPISRRVVEETIAQWVDSGV
ncbi:MAG: M1 family metallopeptidase [Candidatus Eisenbacteria bacterium]